MEKSRGVNLGGWLVAENWMTADAPFWQEIGDQYVGSGEYTAITKAVNPDLVRSKLRDHHANFITESDIRQIAAAGLNTVRVPVGYWIIGYDNQDPANQREWEVYPKGTIQYLDRLIRDWGMKHNVSVLVGLHAAKGSQNGAEHSSPTSHGQSYWSQYSENVDNSIEVVRFLADRYLNDEAFLGIGLLNEPGPSTNESVLYQYYQDAYQAVRSTGSDCVLSIAPTLLKQNPDEMMGFMTTPEFTNVWVEWHPYFVWGYENKTDEHLLNVSLKTVYKGRVEKWNARPGHNPLFIGEWSFSTASNMLRQNPDFFYTFAEEQLKAHELAEGGYTLWSWKARGVNESIDVEAWSLQNLLADDRIGQMLRGTGQYKRQG
uniref:glucan 1,3-beta-glucosidase n=1 Tax=Hyaloperonospora arabidopsidis (strain Emoy2) TaxID=559515 RepID=M4BQB4_HYAAE